MIYCQRDALIKHILLSGAMIANGTAKKVFASIRMVVQGMSVLPIGFVLTENANDTLSENGSDENGLFTEDCKLPFDG